MIFIFYFSLIYWTGILAGLFFVLSFLGCCCHSRICRGSSLEKIRKYHKILIYLAVIFFIIHAGLAMLAKFGVII